jgi:hypothetical protein
MSPRLIRQDQAYDRLAKKYGLATSKQLRAVQRAIIGI